MGFFDAFDGLFSPSEDRDIFVHVLTNDGDEWWTDGNPYDDTVYTMDRRDFEGYDF